MLATTVLSASKVARARAALLTGAINRVCDGCQNCGGDQCVHLAPLESVDCSSHAGVASLDDTAPATPLCRASHTEGPQKSAKSRVGRGDQEGVANARAFWWLFQGPWWRILAGRDAGSGPRSKIRPAGPPLGNCLRHRREVGITPAIRRWCPRRTLPSSP
jgi:hypothetical protein